jgi:hypothetical protein
MAFVRKVTYTFPYERIYELQTGSELQMRLVPATKLHAQESTGMLDMGVWVTQLSDGSIKVVSYTEWYSVEDLQSFGSDPDVSNNEDTLSRATLGGKRDVEIYEVIG